MPRITDILAKHKEEHPDKPCFSFEYFPPKTEQGVENLYARLQRMNLMEPAWFDVTWGAGGSTSDLTMEIVATAENVIGRTTMMHLTCTNMPVSEFKEALRKCKELGIQNILALRGDPPRGEEWQQVEDGFAHAVDLVKFIRKEYGDYFSIAVAGYPEAHEQATSYADDVQHLKEKVDAGADLVITQLFYDVDVFLQFVKDCRAAGITVPILPGIMPIQTYAGFERMTTLCKTKVPDEVRAALEPIQKDEEAVKAYGVELAIKMCRRIWEEGASPGLHFYTLNLEKSATLILRGLGLLPDASEAPLRPRLPWSGKEAREGESVRPVFWSRRPASYLTRTSSWDDFPNGRWGDARSPAYGSLTDFHLGVVYKRTSEADRLAMWGGADLADIQQVHDVFADFCKVDSPVKSLPWCETGLDADAEDMRADLVSINRSGFMTINSQPAVNCKPSSDPVFGWGPANGYVFGKAYLEFFVSPENLNKLRAALKKFPQLQYHAINFKGEQRCSRPPTGAGAAAAAPAGGDDAAPAAAAAAAAGADDDDDDDFDLHIQHDHDGDLHGAHGRVTALTWGVFPGHEIQQPTVVDHSSFLTWREEAFGLWISQWAKLFPEASKGRKLIQDVHDTYWLVNLVDNDFVNGDIFAPFKTLAE